ncbi:projectin-like protein [Bombyx mori]|uniref:Projectin-like protein n=1 Tax=Bombyx mori TaxID=7091 RepID=Q8T104_BOMMO|nr:projectin-like protein [Bombyx mori]BAB85195.1 projectin-like protein [Bombyx mori]BAC10616.1 projectin-like protein [Bombyx mori]
MGNHYSASHNAFKPRKNVHWKSAGNHRHTNIYQSNYFTPPFLIPNSYWRFRVTGRPAPPGKPQIIPILSDDEPNAITLKWAPATHDGGAPLRGYQVECNRLGSTEWIRTAPPIVLRPELVLTGLEPPHKYQFRVAALNDVGHSNYSELSDVLTVSSDRASQEPPVFIKRLEDVTALENDKVEFHVTFSGIPSPTIAWFKDDYEIFSSRRTAITTDESTSVLLFHQILPSDEGEIKCTATNRGGHAVTKARLCLEAAPKLRYPRQYEDGLLYEINETIFLKTTIVGKPTPTIEWRHDGHPIITDDRIEISITPKFSVLKIHSAKRSDRGEYQIQAKNIIGEDTAAFLVTVTAPPDPPRNVSVTRQVDKSVTLDWEPPADDGGCKVGNYIVEYYRTGWNVWLKAITSRKTNVTLFDLIEGSEYKFRIKAESPYGMSAPSSESSPVRIPGRAIDMDFLAVEARIINEALTREDGEEPRISPAPRRKRTRLPPPSPSQELSSNSVPDTSRHDLRPSQAPEQNGSNEFMLLLYPEVQKLAEKTGMYYFLLVNCETNARSKRESFQLDLDSLSPPPLSLSAPDLSSRCIVPFKTLRNAVSTTQLLHERAMARFYKAIEMKEKQTKDKQSKTSTTVNNIPLNEQTKNSCSRETTAKTVEKIKGPEILIESEFVDNNVYSNDTRQLSRESMASDGKWQQISFDEDYTASTVSTDGEYSDEGSFNGDIDRTQYLNEEETYNPRGKVAHPVSTKDTIVEKDEFSESQTLKPLPDPNFVPKPILKRREIPEQSPAQNLMPPKSFVSAPKTEAKRQEKLTLFKKITKMPVQKPFNFPKILSKNSMNKKQNTSEPEIEKIISTNEKNLDKINDEGRTVIDYYGNIVKEYGTHKKSTPIYLNTEDLKEVAEKQNIERTKTQNDGITETNTSSQSNMPKTIIQNKPQNRVDKNIKQRKQSSNNITVDRNKSKLEAPPFSDKHNQTQKKSIPQIQTVLKKTERATIVIPINYQELETKAKKKVRSIIDYTVDMCLLILAFWVYLFKDERLAIPFVILIVYRQLQETIIKNIPPWYKHYTPNWLNKKTS